MNELIIHLGAGAVTRDTMICIQENTMFYIYFTYWNSIPTKLNCTTDIVAIWRIKTKKTKYEYKKIAYVV